MLIVLSWPAARREPVIAMPLHAARVVLICGRVRSVEDILLRSEAVKLDRVW